MAEIWKPKDPELLKSWCQAIIDEASDDLNTWELQFISDIDTKLNNGWKLNQAQEEKLENIYSEKTK